MNINKIQLLIFAVLLSLNIAACGGGGGNNSAPAPVATDYSQAAHWLSIPVVTEAVDVFYFYPTAWTSTDPANPHVCAIDEPTMLTGAASAFGRQATAFETVGNIYAPYYQQDNASPIDRLNVIADIPTLDAIAAFDYYIRHFNNNRPFILVGHSQGGTVLGNLLSQYMKDHPDVLARMVAAYVIGHPITDAYLAENPHLKFAEGPDDTGVIISYNTEMPVVDGTNPVLYGVVGRVINPVNWRTDDTYADKSESQGSFMPDPTDYFIFKPAPAYADARVDSVKGVLICSTVSQALVDIIDTAEGFPSGVCHVLDIPLYYYDLRANALNRANKFLGL